jgi:phosphate-selective porin OprO/OprP
LGGNIGRDYKIGYLIAGEFKGFDTDPPKLWNMTDVSLTFPLWGPQTTLTFGKTKESFSYEMVGDAANLPQQERVLSPFFISRNIGARINHVIGDEERMTVAAGVFNNGLVTPGDFGTDVTTRVTGLVWDRDDGKSFLHLGAAGRYVGGDNNNLRYKGRPESNVTPNYIDTGNIPGDHAWHLGLEALWNEGPFSVLTEYIKAWTSATSAGNPTFSGFYVTGSWVLTGETRPYDKKVGYARRIMPESYYGAWELVARYSHDDLDDGMIQGGSFHKTYFGMNWWATRSSKIGIGWGHTWLDRNDLAGETDALLVRWQWIY